MEKTPLVMMIAFMPFVVSFYVFFWIRFFRRDLVRNFEKRFFHAVVSIMNNNSYDEDCIRQLNLDFKKLSEKHPNLSGDIKSAIDILEGMVCYYDTLGRIGFKSRFNLEIENDVRNKVMRIVDNMKEQNPFVSLSSKDANLLTNLKHSIETGNADLGSTILKQLSEEIEVKESNIRTQQKRNTTAFIIAALGVTLTIFFGLLSFIRL